METCWWDVNAYDACHVEAMDSSASSQVHALLLIVHPTARSSRSSLSLKGAGLSSRLFLRIWTREHLCPGPACLGERRTKNKVMDRGWRCSCGIRHFWKIALQPQRSTELCRLGALLTSLSSPAPFSRPDNLQKSRPLIVNPST